MFPEVTTAALANMLSLLEGSWKEEGFHLLRDKTHFLLGIASSDEEQDLEFAEWQLVRLWGWVD